MKLYHFCAPQFLDGIQREGLTMGQTPILDNGKISLISPTQWLTVDSSFEQPWNGMVMVKYDRTAYRITVKIPRDARGNLLTWQQLKHRLGPENILPGFDDPEFSKSDDWRIYVGVIPVKWLREVAAKSQQAAASAALPGSQSSR